MLKNEIDLVISSKSGKWDDKIAFSPKDIAEMLDIPLSTITKYCREGLLQVFKVGRHYRITRADLYHFIEQSKDDCLII